MQSGSHSHDTIISGTYSSSFNSPALVCESYGTAFAYLDVTTASGTLPTLTIKFQESIDGSNWFDSGYNFIQATGPGKRRLLLDHFGGLQYRAACTIGGTNPSFTLSLTVLGKN